MKFDYGVYSVIPTLFDNNKVDLISIKNLITFQIKSGIKNIVLLGTTSETPTLDDNEQQDIAKFVWENFRDKVNIIIGIGGNNTKSTIENGIKLKEYCNSFMVTVPYYNKPSQVGIYQHFLTISKFFYDKSIMLYNVPSRCGVSMSPEIVAELFKANSNIKAIKEASGNVNNSIQILKLCDIVVLSGDDSLTLPILSIGGKGVVSVASNIVPKKITSLVHKFLNNELSEAIKINLELFNLFKNLFIDTNPVPLKYMLKQLGLCKDCSVRLPLVEIENNDILLTLKNICIQLNEFEHLKIAEQKMITH